MSKASPRIGVQIDLSHDHGVKALLGLRRYATDHCWSLVIEQTGADRTFDWTGADVAGLIVQMIRSRDAGLSELAMPVVSTTSLYAERVTAVYSDGEAVGRLAAEYLLGLPLRHFAFLGQGDRHFSTQRQTGYEQALAAAGFACQSLTEGSASEMLAWLEALPKPVGLLVANDLQAGQLLRACAVAGYDLHQRVAIIGVDNETRICEFSQPTITSIDQQVETIGYLAAVTLDALLRGERVAPRRLVPPRAIVVRESTRLAMIDPHVTYALSLIRQHAHEFTSIDDLLAHIPMSRRTFERRFRAAMGRSPLEEVQRVRLAEAKRLLSTTDLPVEAIARQVGCGSATWLGKLMRTEEGSSPREYRQRSHTAGADG